MPVTTLTTPCWRLVTPEGVDYGGGSDGVPHYDTEADAQQDADDRASGALGIQIDGLTPKPYPAPCVTVTCDGCGHEPESDDFSHLHFPDVANADANLDEFRVADGQVWCEDCRHAPHAFAADPNGQDCARCTWPADEHETDEDADLATMS